MTPNPATMKFVANKVLLEEGVAEFASQKETIGYSSLAERLFDFPFISNVFIARNFITVTKTNVVEWDDVTLELRLFITDILKENLHPVEKLPEHIFDESTIDENAQQPTFSYTPVIKSEKDQEIVNLLEEYVAPAVQNDGGAIHFKSFDDGIVTVILRGACSGCPSSTATLKGGVENLLKSHLPEVKEVVAEQA